MATLRRGLPQAQLIEYAPAESFDTSGADPGGDTPTQPPTSLEGFGIDTSSLLIFVTTGIPINPQVLQQLLNGLIQIASWIAGLFEGVPETAKTLGSGQDLIHANDPISQWVGLNLASGAGAGRVLSEGNWPHNYGGHIIALGGGLIEMVNMPPPSRYWNVRNTLPAGIHSGAPALEYSVGPLPPPAGAPYTQSVNIKGFFAPQPLTPAEYQLKWGVPPPQPGQLVQFLNAQKGLQWEQKLADDSTLVTIRNSFRDLWIAAWKQWLADNPQPTPGGGPPPPVDAGCTDPCELATIEQLYSIALQIAANNTPLMALIPWLPAVLLAIQNLNNPLLGASLQEIADTLAGDLDRMVGDVHTIATAASSSSNPDIKRLADAFDPTDARLAALAQKTAALKHQIASDIPGFAPYIQLLN